MYLEWRTTVTARQQCHGYQKAEGKWAAQEQHGSVQWRKKENSKDGGLGAKPNR